MGYTPMPSSEQEIGRLSRQRQIPFNDHTRFFASAAKQKLRAYRPKQWTKNYLETR